MQTQSPQKFSQSTDILTTGCEGTSLVRGRGFPSSGTACRRAPLLLLTCWSVILVVSLPSTALAFFGRFYFCKEILHCVQSNYYSRSKKWR